MITLTAVREALTRQLAGTAAFSVVAHITEHDVELPARMVVFGDTISGAGLDAAAVYTIDARCAPNTVVELREDYRLVLWVQAIAPDDGVGAAQLEAARTAMLARILAVTSADSTLGITIPGVRQIDVAVANVSARSHPMRQAGSEAIPTSRAAVELQVSATITPAKLA